MNVRELHEASMHLPGECVCVLGGLLEDQVDSMGLVVRDLCGKLQAPA